MKISTKGRYGIRAMIDLAVHSKDEHVPLSSVADRQDISNNYLEQVFSTLRKAGLVKSVKGSQGGYMLAKDPNDITAGMVLRVLEGNLSVIDESKELDNVQKDSIQYFLAGNLWAKIDESINKVVDDLTIEFLAQKYRESIGQESRMYYI
ncbi:MAG: Rrf2 family transcriptional regulator [Eubacteriaceae bacterium]|nr:Rrf2 family transcriptional regulator [Eubacteriaceae bacterium]